MPRMMEAIPASEPPPAPEDDLVIADDPIDTGIINITTGEVNVPQPESNPIITRLLAECDVFQRYGLRAKVIDQLLPCPVHGS
jgi:hypothetical protein